MATPHYSDQIRSGLSRIKEAVSSTVWVHTELSACLEEMARRPQRVRVRLRAPHPRTGT